MMLRLLFLLFAGLLASGAALEAGVRAESRSGWQRLQSTIAKDMLSGSLPQLLRAQLVTSRALVARPDDRMMHADAAYLNAALACDHGLPSLPGVRAALAALPSAAEAGATVPWAGARLATEAWLALCRGDRAGAVELAREATQRDRRDPRPLLVLARAHIGRGELGAATRVLEAAQVRAPGAVAPLVLWAEARLEAGEAGGTVEALREAVARAPRHTRGLLLLEQALAATAPGEADAVAANRAASCARDGRRSAALAASCQLADAEQARRRGQRAQAAAGARAVAAYSRARSRDRAAAVLLLAQLGELDAAAELHAGIPHARDEQLPLRAWAATALALGRGEPPPPILPPVPVHAEARLAAARAALASDGLDALAGLVSAFPSASHPDLAALATAVSEGPAGAADATPAAAYAGALKALAAGDPPTAGRLLERALIGHADACRAAGLYLPILALTGRPPGAALEPLRAVNAGCTELAWTEEEEPATSTAHVP